MAVAAKPVPAQPAPDAAALFERYGDQIYRYCVGRLRDREEAADAVQNTFLRIHVALERGVVPRFESAWLYKIAHNVCLSRIEACGRRARVETPRDIAALDESALAAPATEHEALAGLGEALADLPPRMRKAILLREWQGLSYADIAAAMDTTIPAVETLLCRARRQLAAALEQGGKRVRSAVAGLLGLIPLRRHVPRQLSRLSSLLSGPATTKLAIGAVLAIVGASGVGAAVAVGRDSSPPSRAAPFSAPLTFGSGRGVPLPQGDAGSYLLAAASLGIEEAGLSAGAGYTSAGGTATGSVPAPTVPASLLLPPTSTPGTTLPGVPTVTTPGLTVPSVPTVTTPGVTIPTAPTVTTPGVTIPTVPTVTTPGVTIPTVPTVTTPGVTLTTPTVTTPGLTVTAPTLPTTTSITIPGLGG